MTFSIAKSYLAVLDGIALGDGLIPHIDARVAETVPGDYFVSAHNNAITWCHLLTQTSEWEGTLWDKPDLVDRSRQVDAGTSILWIDPENDLILVARWINQEKVAGSAAPAHWLGGSGRNPK